MIILIDCFNILVLLHHIADIEILVSEFNTDIIGDSSLKKINSYGLVWILIQMKKYSYCFVYNPTKYHHLDSSLHNAQQLPYQGLPEP